MKLINKLKLLCDMGKYALVDRNCQEALVELLALLDLKRPAGLKTLKEALNDLGAEVAEDKA